jgi:5'-3' exonuclease
MNDILTKSKSDNYILFIKGKNTTKSKEAINPEYKADREKLISPKFWTFTKEYLKLTFGAIEVNEIEVDDAVNITRLSIKDSFICAIDSDLLGLTGTHYNWRKDEWMNKTREEEECKFWTDMITGTHNNCKGIPGKGEVYAKKVFFNEISIDGCLASESYNLLTYNAYINSFGEYRGLQEFNKNYFCNKILENYEHFSIPNLIKFNNKKDEEW